MWKLYSLFMNDFCSEAVSEGLLKKIGPKNEEFEEWKCSSFIDCEYYDICRNINGWTSLVKEICETGIYSFLFCLYINFLKTKSQLSPNAVSASRPPGGQSNQCCSYDQDLVTTWIMESLPRVMTDSSHCAVPANSIPDFGILNSKCFSMWNCKQLRDLNIIFCFHENWSM